MEAAGVCSLGRTYQPAHGRLTMHSLLRIVCVAAAVVIACSHARAAERTMPIDFVGDWCSPSQDYAAKNTTWYTLPSWTEGGHCTDILSINKYGFYYPNNTHCEPVNMRLGKSVAPSGTGYIATVTARCLLNGNVKANKLQTFEFYRYKGNLRVTTELKSETAGGEQAALMSDCGRPAIWVAPRLGTGSLVMRFSAWAPGW
jgi:hypothetical protein